MELGYRLNFHNVVYLGMFVSSGLHYRKTCSQVHNRETNTLMQKESHQKDSISRAALI